MTEEKARMIFERLRALDTGERAKLRRAASVPYEQADLQTIGIFLRLLPPDTKQYDLPALFTAVTVSCLWKSEGKKRSFADAVFAMKCERDSDTVEKRFLSLLDEALSADSLFHVKLYRLMRMLCVDGYDVDWPSFAADLTAWNHPDKYIQRLWINRYNRISKIGEQNDQMKEEN